MKKEESLFHCFNNVLIVLYNMLVLTDEEATGRVGRAMARGDRATARGGRAMATGTARGGS